MEDIFQNSIKIDSKLLFDCLFVFGMKQFYISFRKVTLTLDIEKVGCFEGKVF